MIALILSILISANETRLNYGEVFLEDSTGRELPRFSGSLGYGIDLNDSFSDLHSLVGQGQVRIWKYVSTGLLFQYAFPQLSSAGRRLKDLEPALRVRVPQMKWGFFSVTELQFLLGSWNIMNLFQLHADLMIGGGAGLLNSREDTTASGKNSASYIWIVEQRFRVFENAGLYFSVFGNTGGAFISAGIAANL